MGFDRLLYGIQVQLVDVLYPLDVILNLLVYVELPTKLSLDLNHEEQLIYRDHIVLKFIGVCLNMVYELLNEVPCVLKQSYLSELSP